ncbi:hypothetical protein [uncultured Clostridium sp.]|uniref:hypothetical protein n=1 Tax=uncultured Clostridium sp. TaxID=59620 RepID=UPI0027DD9A1D|nr:hypothetical protein [uncultured Clostridium sp.]
MGKLSFRQITDEMYERINADKEKFDVDESKKIFYTTQTEYLIEILEVMGLKGKNKYLKGGHSSKGKYKFLEEDKEFIIEMLMEFKAKMIPLRTANYREADDEFVVWLSEGLIKLFKHNNVPDDKLNEFSYAINNRVHYPLRKRRAIIKRMREKMDRLIDLIFEPRLVNYMTGMDNYIWLLSMEEDYADFISKWIDIYKKMSEIRQDELNDMAEQEAKEMTCEEIEEAEIEFFIAPQFLRKLKEDTEYKKLVKEKNDILGIVTEDISNYEMLPKLNYLQDRKSERNKKKPRIVFTNKKRYEEIVNRICKIEEETKKKVIAELLPMYKLREPFQFMEEPDYSKMCGSDELIKKALEYRAECIEGQKDFEKYRKDMENMPKVDIKKILAEYKKRFE